MYMAVYSDGTYLLTTIPIDLQELSHWNACLVGLPICCEGEKVDGSGPSPIWATWEQISLSTCDSKASEFKIQRELKPQVLRLSIACKWFFSMYLSLAAVYFISINGWLFTSFCPRLWNHCNVYFTAFGPVLSWQVVGHMIFQQNASI